MKLKFDLHIHSEYSHDSSLKIGSIIKRAKKMGLDGVAITDHEEFRGAEIMDKMAKDFIVIKGEEIDTEYGDIIGLFLKKKIKTKKFIEVITEIRKQNGIVILPHPAKFHILSDEVLKEVDIIEVFNARLGDRENEMAEMLAKKKGKAVVAGSDAHFLVEIGNGVVVIESKSRNLIDIKKAILNGNVKLIKKRSSRFLRGMFFLKKILRSSYF